MDEQLLKYFLTQGPFAVLFIWLFLHQMKSSEKRELRYQSLLEAMTQKYDDIVDQLRDIRSRMKP